MILMRLTQQRIGIQWEWTNRTKGFFLHENLRDFMGVYQENMV